MADKAKPAGFSAKRKVTGDDDVEGHRHPAPKATEGLTSRRRDGSPDGFTAKRKVTGDEDVEGHSMLLNPGLARQIAQARERDVQKSLKRHELEHDARSAKKGDR